MSLSVSRLICGDRIGTLWPYPTRTVDWDKTVVPFNLAKLIKGKDILSPITGSNKGLYEEAGQIFRDRIKKKAPVGFSSAKDLIGIQISFDEINPEAANFDEHGEGSHSLRIKQELEGSSKSYISVHIRGLTFFAIQHGLQTLNQLIVYDDINNQFMVNYLPIKSTELITKILF